MYRWMIVNILTIIILTHNIIAEENQLSLKNQLENHTPKEVVDTINNEIITLAYNSYAGIYSKDDRKKLNEAYVNYCKDLILIYNEFGIKSKALINLTEKDSLLTSGSSYILWWKMSFLLENSTVDKNGIRNTIITLEKDLCRDEYYNNVYKYKAYLFGELSGASEEINDLRNYDYEINSMFFNFFPVEQIKNIEHGYPKGTLDIDIQIEDQFIEELYQDYLRFCTNYR
ncbi:MAG: hypothetical protein OEV44_12610 [Spirochaetota bacterium]|nr:hypothetical protein [Spirochaetota bacterium]